MNEAANRNYGAKVHVHFGFSTKTVASLPNKTRIEYLWSLTYDCLKHHNGRKRRVITHY